MIHTDNAIDPGTTLPNGAVAVASDINSRGDGVLLAVIPGNDATPWVVWRFLPGRLDSMYWGEYCRELKAAVEYYEEVCKR